MSKWKMDLIAAILAVVMAFPVASRAEDAKKTEVKEKKAQPTVVMPHPSKEQQARLRDLFRMFYLRSLPGLRELYFAVEKSLEADIPENVAKELAKLALWRINNETPTKAIRNAGKALNMHMVAINKINNRLKMWYFKNPHYA